MLARARERNVYDELVRRELTAYLQDSPGVIRRDRVGRHARLLRAARRVAAAAANALRPGGVLVFTVEELSGTTRQAGYSLSPNGRYRHSRGYLERVLADAGLQSEIVPAELRLEAGEPVAGLVVRSTAAQTRL